MSDSDQLLEVQRLYHSLSLAERKQFLSRQLEEDSFGDDSAKQIHDALKEFFERLQQTKLWLAVTSDPQPALSQLLGRLEVEELLIKLPAQSTLERAAILCDLISAIVNRAVWRGLEPHEICVQVHTEIPEVTGLLKGLGFQVRRHHAMGGSKEETA